jgi:putative MFS transporter
MLQLLERQQTLTGNQHRIVFAAILGDMLEFFDYFLIGFVLAFIVGPWQLTYGESAIILLSSGVGAMLGAGIWGWAADRIGRRKVFIATVLNFAIASGILALTPERGWIFLAIFRFFVGFGVGGLYCVDLPLVQEFVPSSKRGRIGGIITAAIPLGVGLGSVLGAFLAPLVGWRGLFLVGLLPAALTLLIRAWVPESPRWLIRMGRLEEARKSLAWALEMKPEQIDLPTPRGEIQQAPWTDLFKYPRSLAVSCLGNLGAQTGIYGLTLWVPTLFMQVLSISPANASYLMIYVSLGGFVGRIAFSYLSDTIGRRASGGLFGFGATAMIVLTAYMHDVFLGAASLFWLLMIVTYFFAEYRWAIRRGGLASRFTNNRHGGRLRFWRYRQNYRSTRLGADRWLLQRRKARCIGRDDRAGLRLSGRMVFAGGCRLPLLRHGNERTFDRRDRSRARARTGRATLNISFPVDWFSRAGDLSERLVATLN